MLEETFEEFRTNICANLSSLFFETNATEPKNGSIYVMIQKQRWKILGKKKQKLFETVKDISECVDKRYSKKSGYILMNYFPFFLLLKFYSNYHFYFLAIKNEYFHNNNFV